ncbi:MULTISPECIES: YciI family protein [unclassified Nocardioides]|uniref:YciI family protein n=1 Tax=unclassified Nocardioides TaxID=2615069 RepID=UPI0030153B8A
MRFVVLMAEADHFARWSALGEDEQGAVFEAFGAFEAAVVERGGSVVGGEGLAPVAEARTIQPGPDRVVTEGPYAESVEQLGGFFVVDLPDLATAVETARLLPASYLVEVRPASDG